MTTTYDSLSLAMFEALRGACDAVAPESGNLGAASAQQPQPAATTATSTTATNPEDTTDVDNMWRLYRSRDATGTCMMQKMYPIIITRRDDFVRMSTIMEMERKRFQIGQNLCYHGSGQIIWWNSS